MNICRVLGSGGQDWQLNFSNGKEGENMKLDVKAFALTSGIVWGLGLFCLTWWMIAFDGASGEVTLVGRLYRGYSISATGSFIGLLWALVDGFVGGAIFASLYNFFVGRGRRESAD